MTETWITLGDPRWLHGLWLVPAAALLAWGAARRGRRLMRRFAGDAMLPVLTASVSRVRQWVKSWIVAAALGLIALALARPQSNPVPIEVERRGRDIVFVVDVSRSMLARDLAPNRLERAKLWINDLVGSLRSDRVGLVAFAGAATVKCPLTIDRDFFKLELEQLSPRSAPVGGTYIGDAIRKAISDVFDADGDAGGEQVRDIILITDGEDMDSLPVEAAAAARAAGVRIIALGVGSESGTPVPTGDGRGDGLLRHEGQIVMSRLDADQLAEVAAASGGVFLNVGTDTLDLEQVYRDLIASEPQRTTATGVTTVYTERFVPVLIAALLLLAFEPMIRDRRKGAMA